MENRRLVLSEYPEVMTIKDVCEFLSISRTTAYKFIKENTIKYLPVGREYRILKSSLAEALGL